MPRSSGISILLYQNAMKTPTSGRKYSVQLCSCRVSVAHSSACSKRRADRADDHADDYRKQAPSRKNADIMPHAVPRAGPQLPQQTASGLLFWGIAPLPLHAISFPIRIAPQR